MVYAFTPQRDMVVTISTCDGAGSNFDTKLVVFKNNINTVVECRDDAPTACAGYRAAVRSPAETPGQLCVTPHSSAEIAT